MEQQQLSTLDVLAVLATAGLAVAFVDQGTAQNPAGHHEPPMLPSTQAATLVRVRLVPSEPSQRSTHELKSRPRS